ncbi:MAG: DinB family protein [Burkholderiales bacterium]|nr:DinB family protein [Burkholderiales bacterium]MDE1929299.1 DinB family protein [Burkholderiales bacterium]MDE2161394.1 DinB family protein [Burkholderiales bacterium]MDE2502532.1 DinB family protein [Burkholderiales bacterium]
MLKALDRSPLREQLQTMARYNLWATRRLCAAVDALSEADYRRDAGLHFRSVHGTLNHLLVGEHELWFRRFVEGASPQVALDAEIEPGRLRLRERLLEGALAWLPLIEVWSEERLRGTLQYRSMSGREHQLPFATTLLHVFNHGTHHRGQISAALTALRRPAPEIDLVYMLQEEAGQG